MSAGVCAHETWTEKPVVWILPLHPVIVRISALCLLLKSQNVHECTSRSTAESGVKYRTIRIFKAVCSPCLIFDLWPVLEVLGVGLDVLCLQHQTSVVQDCFADLQKTQEITELGVSAASRGQHTHMLTTQVDVCGVAIILSTLPAVAVETLLSTKHSTYVLVTPDGDYWLLRWSERLFQLHSRTILYYKWKYWQYYPYRIILIIQNGSFSVCMIVLDSWCIHMFITLML